MSRTSSAWRIRIVTLVVCGIATLAGTARPTEVTRPFKIKGGGIAPEGLRPPGEVTTHLINGTATQLGHHTGEGSFDIFSFNPSATGFEGTFASHDPCVFVAANGDELVTFYGRTDKGAAAVGTFVITVLDVTSEGLLVEAEFHAEFVVQPESTGRFAGASGSWFMIANTEPFILGSNDPVAYTWHGESSITFSN